MVLQFFLEEHPSLAVAEVTVKHEPEGGRVIFRCTCKAFTPASGCKHVREVVDRIKEQGQGNYTAPMTKQFAVDNPTWLIQAAETDPQALRDLLIRYSKIEVL